MSDQGRLENLSQMCAYLEHAHCDQPLACNCTCHPKAMTAEETGSGWQIHDIDAKSALAQLIVDRRYWTLPRKVIQEILSQQALIAQQERTIAELEATTQALINQVSHYCYEWQSACERIEADAQTIRDLRTHVQKLREDAEAQP